MKSNRYKGNHNMKIAFLDRDGTINKDYPDQDWKERVIPEILEGTIEGLSRILELGYDIIIVTNQYIINEGIIAIEQYQEFHKNLMIILDQNSIKILDTFYCPHTEAEHCNCKKPKTGLIAAAIQKYPDIELKDSIFIGDSLGDQQLANKFGIKFFGINGLYFKNGFDSINEVMINNKEIL
ncbi:HAD-IIIA family hydrolase [Fusibacter bizertensis]